MLSALITSMFDPVGLYGLGWPMYFWHCADRVGASGSSSSSSPARISFSRGLCGVLAC